MARKNQNVQNASQTSDESFPEGGPIENGGTATAEAATTKATRRHGRNKTVATITDAASIPVWLAEFSALPVDNDTPGYDKHYNSNGLIGPSQVGPETPVQGQGRIVAAMLNNLAAQTAEDNVEAGNMLAAISAWLPTAIDGARSARRERLKQQLAALNS